MTPVLRCLFTTPLYGTRTTFLFSALCNNFFHYTLCRVRYLISPSYSGTPPVWYVRDASHGKQDSLSSQAKNTRRGVGLRHLCWLEQHAYSAPWHSWTWVSAVSQEYRPAKSLSPEWRGGKREHDCRWRCEVRNSARTPCCRLDEDLGSVSKQEAAEEGLPVESNTGSSAAVGGNNSERNEAGASHFLMHSLWTSSGFYRIGPNNFQKDHNSYFQHLLLFPYVALELLPLSHIKNFSLNSCFKAFFLPSQLCSRLAHHIAGVWTKQEQGKVSLCSKGQDWQQTFCLVPLAHKQLFLSEMRVYPRSDSR